MLERLEESSIKLLGQLIARIGKTLQLRDAFIEAVKVRDQRRLRCSLAPLSSTSAAPSSHHAHHSLPRSRGQST